MEKFALGFSSRVMGLALILTFGALAGMPGMALAQGTTCPPPVAPYTPPCVDHYLVYPVINVPPITFPVTVLLTDQFSARVPHQTATLNYFMIPVNKNNEGIIDPVTHYTWWFIDSYQFQASAVIQNQFSPSQPMNIFGPHYLLNPALKYPQPGQPIPVKNHFKVYGIISTPLTVPSVSLVDQFYPYQAQVNNVRWLALPAEKLLPVTGQDSPIVDPVGHLAIYYLQLLTPPPTVPSPVVTDEFGTWQLVLGPPQYLAVPSYKTGVTGIQSKTWGELKQLYR